MIFAILVQLYLVYEQWLSCIIGRSTALLPKDVLFCFVILTLSSLKHFCGWYEMQISWEVNISDYHLWTYKEHFSWKTFPGLLFALGEVCWARRSQNLCSVFLSEVKYDDLLMMRMSRMSIEIPDNGRQYLEQWHLRDSEWSTDGLCLAATHWIRCPFWDEGKWFSISQWNMRIWPLACNFYPATQTDEPHYTCT